MDSRQPDRGSRGLAIFVAAWAAGWAFAVAFGLYAYYEDGPTAVALAVAVRFLPAALITPYARRLAGRVPFAYALAARAALLGLVALAVSEDVSFPLVLALIAVVRVACAADRWYFAALDPHFDGSPAAMRAADATRRDLDDLSLLAGAAAAGIGMLTLSLHVVFALCALALLVIAALAAAHPLRAAATSGPYLGLTSRAPRRLHLVRGGRGVARAAVELLAIVVAIELLAMEDSGVAWLTGALAIGLLAGARSLPAPPIARQLGVTIVLAGVPVALLALDPPASIALALLALVGLGFALCRKVECTLEDRVPRSAHIEGEELVDALARIGGATLAAALVLALGDSAGLVAAGALVALLGAGVPAALDPRPAAESAEAAEPAAQEVA